jgi:hypothetical protein
MIESGPVYPDLGAHSLRDGAVQIPTDDCANPFCSGIELGGSAGLDEQSLDIAVLDRRLKETADQHRPRTEAEVPSHCRLRVGKTRRPIGPKARQSLDITACAARSNSFACVRS